MSGNGNHDDQRSNPLGGKLKDELRSALRLLFKNVDQHAAELTFSPCTTVFLTDIPAEATPVALNAPSVMVSDDPVQLLANWELPHRDLPLLEEAILASDAPCHIEPALCHEPVFEEMAFESTGISFANMAPDQSAEWPVTPCTTEALGQPIEAFPKPASIPVSATLSGNLKSHSVRASLSNVPTRQQARFYALPIRKASIPPHRFTLAQRERFRQALAEKAGTHPANVQLKVVFGRMHMALYNSIQPDEQGNLLCIPKGELLGRNRELQSAKALLSATASDMTYLAIGTRLDTKADIRALVPVEIIKSQAATHGEESST